MKRLYIAAFVAALTLIATMAELTASGELEWKTISQGLENAPRENKLIMLDIYTDWCGWCKRMDRDTFSDSVVASYLKQRYIACKMNPEKKGKVTFDGKEFTLAEFGQALGVRGYPATAFFNEKGELLTVVSGYMSPKDFLPVLKYFGDGAYLKGVKYEDYVKQNASAQ